MRWILDNSEFLSLLERAHHFLRHDNVDVHDPLTKLLFDDAALSTASFFGLLLSLMKCSADTSVSYVVVDPDPIEYFHRRFGKYPAIEISRADTADTYLMVLNKDPGGSPADAIGTNVGKAVFVPGSASWFAQVSRSADDDGGFLVVPSAWVRDLMVSHRWLRACRTYDR